LHLRLRTKVEWDSENELTEFVNHPRLAGSRALNDGDCVGVWFSAFHLIEQPIQDFVGFTAITLLPCVRYCWKPITRNEKLSLNVKRIITALWGDMSIKSECGMTRVAHFEDRHIEVYESLVLGRKRALGREEGL
jgi:hypothetical protein